MCHSAAWWCLLPCSPQSSEPTECCSVEGCLTSCIEPGLIHVIFTSFESYRKLDRGFAVLFVSVWVIVICSTVWQFRQNLKESVVAIVSCMLLPGSVRLRGAGVVLKGSYLHSISNWKLVHLLPLYHIFLVLLLLLLLLLTYITTILFFILIVTFISSGFCLLTWYVFQSILY
jgi:hypothetical protein